MRAARHVGVPPALLQQGCDMSCSRECVRLLPVMLPQWVYRRLGEQCSRPTRCSSSRRAAPGGTLLCHPGDAQIGRTQRVTSVCPQRSALGAVSRFPGLQWCLC